MPMPSTRWIAAGVVLAGTAQVAYCAAQTVDYNEVKKDIAEVIGEAEDYDDGSYGPLFVRLAWHAAGTHCIFGVDGGSNGATMRFSPECKHGANAGLGVARALLEVVKSKHPGLSYADLWTLAGCVAIEEMGGPKVSWRSGRSDAADGSSCPPDGRLPDAARGPDHLRAIFYRMGMSDQEIVALSGAHALGRCHTSRSGFEGPWTYSPTTFTNDYFKLLLTDTWTVRQWDGPTQYENKQKDLMMLPTDMALVEDPEFKKWVLLYADDEKLWMADFSAAFGKLMNLGVPFHEQLDPKPSPSGGWFSWLF